LEQNVKRLTDSQINPRAGTPGSPGRVSRFWLMFAVVGALPDAGITRAAELPKTVSADACRKAPTIDGVIADNEWHDARLIEFDMPMLQVNPQSLSKRACQLRVMNSANGLYVALCIPDETLNKSLNPFDIDFALLAFSRGKELVAGDDRKVVGPGIYVDKHFDVPGKDADDKQQHGKGAMAYAKGVSTIEWAMPLDSGDDEDVRAKPGGELRFNLAYFDAFRAELKGTQIGAAYEGGLDNAANWGSLQLARDVEPDDGVAFRVPVWVTELFQEFRALPANRLRLVESTVIGAGPQSVVKAFVEFPYRDPKGQVAIGKAKLYLPATVQQKKQKLPLYYSGGYELDDNGAAAQVARGAVVATPRAPEANPLVRTVNPDTALLHIVRALPFVDDSKVILAGGSAGGYITLMLAAETFPLAGAAPDVPPINWGYNAAFFLQRERPGTAAADPSGPKVPVFDVIVPIVKQAQAVYGADTNSPVYFANSPLAHLPTVTCPVSVYWTTADMLVPIDQVGAQWIRPFDPRSMPKDFTMDREKLTTTAEGRKQLVDVLKQTDYELFIVAEATIKQQAEAKQLVDLGDSSGKQWSITILDEGAPTALLGHLKYQTVPHVHRTFLDRVTAATIAPAQLTSLKLERLMDRYAGREWLPAGLVHLDAPEVEQSDVVRSLTTYVVTGPEHAQRFAELYARLPVANQVLPPDVVKTLIKK
jgi:hypothetical protein